MKKVLLFMSGAAMVLFLATSCGGGQQPEQQGGQEQQQAAATYECPMKCEGKTYTEPGKCSVCGMDLVKVEPQAGG